MTTPPRSSSSSCCNFRCLTGAVLFFFVLLSLARPALGFRAARYVQFDPPRIYPEQDSQTVKSGSSYGFRCEGSRGISWRLPIDTTDDLRRRLTVKHHVRRGSRDAPDSYVSELMFSRLSYKDTGTYVCTYNGTKDTSSIDNSTRVHLYVEDDSHLLKQGGVDFMQATQSATFILPCQPTRPNLQVDLVREGNIKIDIDKDEFIEFDPKVGFRISPVTMDQHSGLFKCVATLGTNSSKYVVNLKVLLQTAFVPPPHINKTLARHVGIGGEISMTCSVTIDFNVMVDLRWQSPNTNAKREGRLEVPHQTARNLSMGHTHLKIVEQSLRVRDVTMDDQGTYECTVEDHSGNTKTKREFVRVLERQEPHLDLITDYTFSDYDVEEDHGHIQWVVHIDSHPREPNPKVVWYGPNGRPIPDPSDPYRTSKDYTVTTHFRNGKAQSFTMLKVNRLRLENSGKYKLKATNGEEVKEENFSLVIRAKPKVQATVVNSQTLYPVGHEFTLKCSARGYPVPKIHWMFRPCSTFVDCDNGRKEDVPTTYEDKFSAYGRDAVVKHVARKSGMFICQVRNDQGFDFKMVPFFVTDVQNGFAVEGPREVLQEDHMKLKCSASVYNYTRGSIRWIKKSLHGDKEMTNDDSDGHYRIISTSTEFSFSQELQFLNVSLHDKGRYVCRVRATKHGHQDDEESPGRAQAQPVTLQNQYYNDASAHGRYLQASANDDDRYEAERTLDLNVLPLVAPKFVASNLEGTQTAVQQPEDGLRLECRISGRPEPDMQWTLDGRPVNVTINTTRVRLSEDGQILSISYFSSKDEGLYACVARNKVASIKRVQSILLQSTLSRDQLYANISLPVIVAVAASILLVMLLILSAKLCYSRRKRSNKDPPTPPTPRLTQYEIPHDQEELDELDECRMTLTSNPRDGSISPYGHLHINSLATSPQPGGSLLGTLGAAPVPPPAPHCHCHGSIYGCHSAAGTPAATLARNGSALGAFSQKCSMCEFPSPAGSVTYATTPFQHLTLQRFNHAGILGASAATTHQPLAGLGVDSCPPQQQPGQASSVPGDEPSGLRSGTPQSISIAAPAAAAPPRASPEF